MNKINFVCCVVRAPRREVRIPRCVYSINGYFRDVHEMRVSKFAIGATPELVEGCGRPRVIAHAKKKEGRAHRPAPTVKRVVFAWIRRKDYFSAMRPA